MLTLLLLLSSLQAQTLRTVCASGCDHALSALQDAIDAATCGDIIQIAAGATATKTGGTPLTLRNKSACLANGPYITIRSSGVTNLTPGARVTPADSSNLATITMDTGPYTALTNEKGAAWYRFHGIRITAPSTFGGDLVEFGTRTPVVSYVADHEIADLAHHIVFDQCYFHGDAASTDGPRRGIRANLGHMEVRNSWFENFKNQSGESNAIGGWNGNGPFFLENNHFEAAGITTLFGGAEPNIKGIRANGSFFTGNHYYRRWAWRKRSNTGDPSGTCLYDSNGGEYYINTAGGPSYWRCDSGTWTSITVGEMIAYYLQKNVFELKNAWRSWVEGNFLENAWQPAGGNQFGAMFLFNLVDNDPGSGPLEAAATVGHVTIKNNYGRRTSWVATLGSIGDNYYLWHNNIHFDNNVFDQIGDSPWTLPAAELNGSKWGGGYMQFPSRGANIRYTHNTMISRSPVESRTAYLFGTPASQQAPGAVIAGNVMAWNKYGLNNDVDGGSLWNSVPNGLAEGRIVTRNVFVNNESQTAYTRPYPIVNVGINLDAPSDINAAVCTAATYDLSGSGATNNGRCGFPAAYSDVGFSNFGAGTLAGLKLSSGIYKAWGPFGRDVGADTDVVGWSTSGVTTDAATLPTYLKFQVRQVKPGQTWAIFRYTAPTTAACTTTMSTKADLSSPTINALTDGGGDLDRYQIDVNGLSSNTRYFWRITCGDGTSREGIVTTL